MMPFTNYKTKKMGIGCMLSAVRKVFRL